VKASACISGRTLCHAKRGGLDMEVRTEWVKCPVCGNKTRNKIRKDTVLKRFPLFCPKCKRETLIEVENLLVKVVEG